MIHIVRQGETYRRIAARYYGDWTLWCLITDANGMNRRTPPMPGVALEIPEPRWSATEHIVETGDSYESLAGQYYGSEHFADYIRRANDEVVIYDNVGQRFVIPPLVTATKLAAMGKFNVT